MGNDRRGNHTVCHLSVHLVWVTKYRYPVLNGDLKERCRDLLRQVCMTLDVRVLKGVVSKDHVHMHVEYPPVLCVSELVKRLKGSQFSIVAKGVSEFEKALLGPSLLGNWVWLLEYRKHYGRYGKRISGAPSKRIKSGG